MIVLGAGVFAAGVGVVALVKKPAPIEQTAIPASAAPPTSGNAAPVSANEAPVATRTTPPSAETKTALEEEVNVVVRSEPKGAQVFLNGRMIGVAPKLLKTKLPVEVMLKLDGYKDTSEVITAAGEKVVNLARKAGHAAKPVAGAPVKVPVAGTPKKAGLDD